MKELSKEKWTFVSNDFQVTISYLERFWMYMFFHNFYHKSCGFAFVFFTH